LFHFPLLGSHRQDIMIAQLVALSKVCEANLPHRLRCSVAWFDAQGTQACEGARKKHLRKQVLFSTMCSASGT